MLRVAICGGSGYAGAELLRLLAAHPEVKVTTVTSEKSAGKKVTDIFPHLRNYSHLVYERLEREKIVTQADLFFMALPHAASQQAVDFLVRNKKKVIDLSADYRLRDPIIYEEWYKVPHNFQGTLRRAVYGIPELYRKRIAKTPLVANPGCYPTGAILGLYPALKNRLVKEPIIIDSKSGTSGAGRQSDASFSYCEINEGFKAYSVAVHRHTPEIEQELSAAADRDIRIDFTPHIVPMDRGILSTMYAKLAKDSIAKNIHRIYAAFYRKEPFVRVLEPGKFPNVKNVRGTNFCDLGISVNKRTNTLIIVSAIDNLMKGASGQAVHNMNIMMGYDEETALDGVAVFP